MTLKSSRFRKGLLVLSLAMNLIFIGVVAGMFVFGHAKGPSQRFDLTAGPMTRAMDNEHRAALRQALHDSGVFRREDRARLRADAASLLDVIRAETFDSTVFRATLDRRRARLNQGQMAVLDALTQQVSEMSAAERGEFADRLEEQLRRQPPSRQSQDE